MIWNKVAEFPGDSQLKHLDDYLSAHGVMHRFTEESGKQVLWLADVARINVVARYFELLKLGKRPDIPRKAETAQGKAWSAVLRNLAVFPLTVCCLVLGFFGYLIADVFQYWPVLKHLLFLPFLQGLEQGETWRVVSPVFLHYGFLHLLLNGLGMWEIGRRVELFSGRLNYFILFMMTAIGGNYLQFVMSDSKFFGGLSGVLFGLIGYMWFAGRHHGSPLVKMPPGIYVFTLVWLLAGFAGVFKLLFDINMANWAHLGGMLAGIATAAAEVYLYPKKKAAPEADSKPVE